MAASGVCGASLEDPRVLMKTGLSTLLVGHVNFLLAALVHGVVLRHISLHQQARAMEYAISNVVALTSGLVGVVVGILAIILSKNRHSRGLAWALFTLALLASLMAVASAIGLLVSTVRAIIHGGRSLLTHCRFPDAIGYSSITNECPFDPTRIYSTTLILWVPLVVMCVVQLVFTARCCAACVALLRLPCFTHRKRTSNSGRTMKALRPLVEAPPAARPPPPRSLQAAPAPPPPPRQQRRPAPPPHQHHQHPPRLHHSLPPSERRPLRQPRGERSTRPRQEARAEQHQLLSRGGLDRSSFWV